MRKIILLFLAGLFIFLISCSGSSNYLPEEIYDLKLTKVLSGKEAEEFVNNLHFQKVTDLNNEVGFYEGERGLATIYLTIFDTKEVAMSNYSKMKGKIFQENSPFIKPEYVQISGKDIYRFFGLGQSHYVFTVSNVLYWVSVDTHFGKKFIAELLIYIS